MKKIYMLVSQWDIDGHNPLHVGSKEECELGHKVLSNYGISDHKYEIVEKEVSMFGLTDQDIEVLKDEVFHLYKAGSYGEEQLEDYFQNDIDNLTFADLIDQAEQGLDDENNPTREVINKYKMNKQMDEELRKGGE